MNIEGNTYLFYDKYCQDHRYQNPDTSKITFNDLYNSDYTVYEGKNAINEFNKFGGIYTISTNIDTDFYQLSFFVIPSYAGITHLLLGVLNTNLVFIFK